MPRCHIYLVPGFFGFTSLGSINYFFRVAETLRAILRDAHGVDAAVIECRTKPTASIAWRAAALLDEVLASGGGEADALHFVGHSMGGLDLRLLLAPGAAFARAEEQRAVIARTRSVTTIATPHFGSPIAGFFTTLPGRQILRLLAGLATKSLGRRAIVVGSQLVTATARLEERFGWRSPRTYWARQALGELSADPEHPIWAYFQEMATDQGAIIQLTPEAMHLFNAATSEAPGIDYGCVLTGVRKPRSRDVLKRLLRPYEAGSLLLFWLLYHMAARKHPHYPYASLDPDVLADIERRIGFALNGNANDGVAPTLSQLHGRVVHVTESDHLDVVGQFAAAGGERYADWMASGSGFDDARFKAVWREVAARIVSAGDRPTPPAKLTG